MSSGKYLKKPQNSRKKSNQKYSIPSRTKLKIGALLTAATLMGTAIIPPPSTEATSTPVETIPTEPTSAELVSVGILNNDSTIIVNGQELELDDSSFAIVSQDTSVAYDKLGNRVEGIIDSKDFIKVFELTEEQMENYTVVYQINSNIEVNMRSSGEIIDGNIISTVPALDYVLGYSKTTDEYDNEWIHTLSISGNEICEGYIREDLLREFPDHEIYMEESIFESVEKTMYVDTSFDNYIDLNLRTSPQVSGDTLIEKIPHGSALLAIGESVSINNRNWTKVTYQTADGNQLQGYVSSNYLSDEPVHIPVVKPNASGTVTGIDISSMSAEQLEKLLQSEIPSSVGTAGFGDVNTSKVSGDINFVYIKLGASGYGKGDLRITDYNEYTKQVKICEKLGIPYGFYYYSTSITEEEANIELNYIQEKIEQLRSEINMENYKLGVAVDIELASSNDRQYKGNIEEKTQAKATLINGLQESGVSDNITIYGPARVMRKNLDQIIDLEQLRSILNNPDDVAFWLCSPYRSNGKSRDTLEEDIATIEEHGFDVVALQVVLDGKVIGKIDINTMNLSYFEHVLDYQSPENGLVQIPDTDNER